MTSRRRFIKTGVTVAAGLALTGKVNSKGIPDPKELSPTTYRSLVGEEFSITALDSSKKGLLKLVEARDVTNPHDGVAGVERECLSLLFEGEQESGFEQGNYRIFHSSTGTEVLFVVPVTNEKGVFEVNFDILNRR